MIDLRRSTRPRVVLATATFALAAGFALHAAWIPIKAEVAQVLLQRAWSKSVDGHDRSRPWPWADTSPVGLLEVPGLGIRQIILSGTSGRNLAFGPTLLSSPVQGDLLLSGHRDTHFSFLKSLEQGALLRVTTLQGVREYRVSWLEVIDSRSHELVLEPGSIRLTLMTCYPFHAATAGGPLRYVVTAEPVSYQNT